MMVAMAIFSADHVRETKSARTATAFQPAQINATAAKRDATAMASRPAATQTAMAAPNGTAWIVAATIRLARTAAVLRLVQTSVRQATGAVRGTATRFAADTTEAIATAGARR